MSAKQRSKAEERMIRIMTKKGGKGFRVLRSAEATLKQYRRPSGSQQAEDGAA